MWNNYSWTDWLSSSFPFPLIYLNLKSAWRKKGLSHFLLITLSLSSLESFSQQHFPFRSLLFAEDDGQDNESESLSVESGRVGPGPRTSRIVCGPDVDVMAPAPASSSSSSRRVTAVSLSVLTETRRIHASTAAPPAPLAVIVASADRVVVNRRPAEPGCETEQLIRVIVVGGNTL